MTKYEWWTRIIDGRVVIMNNYSDKEPKVYSDNIGRIIKWESEVNEVFRVQTNEQKSIPYPLGLIKHLDPASLIDLTLPKIGDGCKTN